MARILADIPDYHATPVQVAELAASAQVAHLLYYHAVPTLVVPGSAAAFLDGVAAAYAGDVTLGSDGTLVTLPRDASAIRVGHRGP